MTTNKPDAERFWEKVEIRGDDECWPWIAGFEGPYGRFRFRGTSWLAHRVAYVLTNGEIAEGMDILHSCDFQPCCNPKHLREGTDLDNVRDKYARERFRHLTCEEHGMSKLTRQLAQAIRKDYAAGDTSQPKLAKKYGVGHSTIGRVVRGEAWPPAKRLERTGRT